ncbi:hypothetical protein TNCV_1795401 [Trichonephila clavipes]|nr:hypothetical protein TNCV_1795401 [Trichonephila clavipes]
MMLGTHKIMLFEPSEGSCLSLLGAKGGSMRLFPRSRRWTWKEGERVWVPLSQRGIRGGITSSMGGFSGSAGISSSTGEIGILSGSTGGVGILSSL